MPDLFRPLASETATFSQGFSKENYRDNMKPSNSNPAAPPQDWHPADVHAALKKRGQTLAGLSVANGYHPTAAGKALREPWPALEAIIARALGVPPATIWPSRYDEAGNPRRSRSAPR
jgi:Ner family transcriptional regulator